MSPPNNSDREGGDASSLPRSSKNTSTGFIYYEFSDSAKLFVKEYRTPVAAGTSTVASTFVAFPLDFAKSRMQSYNTGFLETVKDAYKAEGLRGFWRGVTTPLFSVTAVRTLSFTIYQRSKYAFDDAIQRVTGNSPLEHANKTGAYPSLSTIACFGLSGATSGALITCVSCPFELVKLHGQLAGKMARDVNPGDRPSAIADLKTGAVRTASQLIRERGFRGLYLGFKLHTIRDTIGTSIYFVTYESVKQLLANAQGGPPTSPPAVALAGGICGIVSWACIYPIDVVKTVYQKQMLAGAKVDVNRPEIRFFQTGSYRGLGVSMARSAIINMIFFSSFEMVKRKINEIEVGV